MLISGITWLAHGGESGAYFEITEESLLFSTAMALRLGATALAVLIFLATTKPDDFHAGLILLGLPYPVAFTVSLTYRLVPAFIGIGIGIVEAQTSRGLDLGHGKPLHRLRKLMALLVPLVMHAVRQAKILTVAIHTRGFNPSAKRSFYRDYRLHFGDYLSLGFLVLSVTTCIVLRSVGFGIQG
jgi:energy-coupling factor transport system permease protein